MGEEVDDDPLSKTVVLSLQQDSVDSGNDLSSDHAPHNVSQSRDSRAAQQDITRVGSSSPCSEEEDGPSPSFISNLPSETLTRILALLNPSQLQKASLVCRQWFTIARDDATWRLAFCKAFGLGGGAGVLRRTDASSWKAEYCTRLDLIRRWRKSRSPAISSDMRVANIDSLALSYRHSFLLSASSSYGVASRSDPFRGKVARGFLDAAGLLNGGGIGNPNTEFSPDVSCLAISTQANRIAWGFKTGAIAVTSLGRQGSNPHGLIRNVRFSPRGSHLGEVHAIAYDLSVKGQRKRSQARQVALGAAAECFVSGGADGTVRLWSPDRALPIWIGSTAPETQADTVARDGEGSRRATSAPLASVTKLDFDADIGVIAAGTASGYLYVWSHIDVRSLISLSDQAWSESEGHAPEITTASQDAAKKAFKDVTARVIKTIVAPVEGEPRQALRNVEGEGQIDFICLAADNALSVRAIVHRKGGASLEYHLVTETSRGLKISTKALAMAPANGHSQLVGQGHITCVRAELGSTKVNMSLSEESRTAPSPALQPALDSTASSQCEERSLSPKVEALKLRQQTSHARNLSAGPFAEQDFVCAGTSSGYLVGWILPPFEELEEEVDAAARSQISRAPVRGVSDPTFVLDCHQASLTSLDLAPHLFVVGTVDGQLKAFDSLTGESVRTWTDRTATKHLARQLVSPDQTPNGALSTDERERFTVKQILLDEEWLIAAIGPWVLAWKPETALSGHQKRHASRLNSPYPSGTPPAGSRRTSGMPALSKYARMKELKTELAESSLILQREKEARQASYERLRFARDSDEVGGLSEDEALEYAIILSRHEAEEQAQHPERRNQREGFGHSSELARIRHEDRELQDALEQIALAEANEGDATTSNRGTSPRSRYSPSEADDLSFGDEDGDEDEDYHNIGEDADDFQPRSRYLSPSPHTSPQLQPRSPNSFSSLSRAWDILRSSRSASSSGAASPLPISSSALRSRWGEHTKVQTVRVSREHWSPQVQPVNADSSSVRNAFDGTNSLEDSWPVLRSSSYSSSQHSVSSLAQEEGFRLDADDGPHDALDFQTSSKGKGRADSARSLPPSIVPPPSEADAASANLDLPPPTSPTPQQASKYIRPPATPLTRPLQVPTVSSPALAVRGAWARGTPSFSNTAATSSQSTSGWPHASSSPTPWTTQTSSYAVGSGAGAIRPPRNDEDDDLRFAIELSLAEERSKAS